MKKLYDAIITTSLMAVLFVFVSPCFGLVSGTVTCTDGTPLEFATVVFTDESGKGFRGYTDQRGAYSIDLSTPTGIGTTTPFAFSLGQNYPNPFNPTTRIPFTLDAPGLVNITVYNIMGQKIATIIDNYMNAGLHQVTWNGLDDHGNFVSAGIYLYQLKAGPHSETRKMLQLDGGGSQMMKHSVHSGTQRASKISAQKTYSVTITHTAINTYKKTGVAITDGQTMDFVVTVIGELFVINGISFVSIPGGTFQMGDEEYSSFGYSNEQPVHSVTVSGFEMGIYEITQGQYQSVMGSNPSYFKSGDNYPVEKVSWYDAVKFCNRLSDAVGFVRCYDESTWACDFSKNGYRLPTEAEWEYACRAGIATLFYTGDAISGNGYTSTDLDKAGWYYGNSGSKTHPVGEKVPNSWGLYDMHGNVWEWCHDWYGESYYSSSLSANPPGPSTGSDRVERGGGWGSSAGACRSAGRNGYYPSDADGSLGFRVVRQPAQGNPKISFVSIPGGTFQMGDVENYGLFSDEKPVHSVTVSGFEMGIYEVTNAQYCAYLNAALASGDITATSTSVKGARGSYNGKEYIYLGGTIWSIPDARCWITYTSGSFSVVAGHENWPVVWVTWYGSKAFALYYGLDLPTEAEWEYACRGGRQYKYGTDDGTLSQSKANYWDNGPRKLIEVGSYPANPYGLFDMSGNVEEWCHDWYLDSYYSSSPTKDPSGAHINPSRVVRGGSWKNSYYVCRSAHRNNGNPDGRECPLGFRVVRRLSPQNY